MRLTDLPWLERAPDDFRARCKAATDGNSIRRLAGYALDLNQLNSLAKKIAGLDQPESLTPFRLGLISNATTAILAPALVASAARHGFVLEVVEAPFDQAMQVALDPASVFNQSAPDVVLLAFDQRLVAVPDDMSSAGDAEHCIDHALQQITAISEGIEDNSGATVIVQTLSHPPTHIVGGYDRRMPGSPHTLIDNFNARLIDGLKDSARLLLDVGGLSDMVGLDTWHDAAQWHWAKLSFSQDAVPLYSDHVCRLLAAMRGKSRKCLVLDLDNTLWGGIIGDDGLGGIVIGHGDPIGEAFLDIQRTVISLNRLGIILAVSSKNEDKTARLPFVEHPDMLLKESNIAVFQANWQDKATNLEAIADALDIGLDSLVLLDDNPAERAQVRDALPDVAVPELPDDPALFPRTLLAAGYFDTVALSGEDRIRAMDYAARAKRVELKGGSRDLQSYLASLDMEISFSRFDSVGRGRIVQLINKSNQFNLTTRRYSVSEVAAMEDNSSVFAMQVRLSDRFGDNGMISVVICRIDGERWDIDSWLMSCRVLGRGVEGAVLKELVRNAVAGGASCLRGCYSPTDRNGLVSDHYSNLGFKPDGKDGKNTWWRLDTGDFRGDSGAMRTKEIDI